MKDFDKVSAFESDETGFPKSSAKIDKSIFRKSDFGNKSNTNFEKTQDIKPFYPGKSFVKDESNKVLIFSILGYIIPIFGLVFSVIAVTTGHKQLRLIKQGMLIGNPVKLIIGMMIAYSLILICFLFIVRCSLTI